MIFFGVKSWFFTWNTLKISRAPPKIGKIWFFCVKSWFFTRNTPKIFAPPSARRNFFKCAPPPLTWNPGSAPGYHHHYLMTCCKSYCFHWELRTIIILLKYCWKRYIFIKSHFLNKYPWTYGAAMVVGFTTTCAISAYHH